MGDLGATEPETAGEGDAGQGTFVGAPTVFIVRTAEGEFAGRKPEQSQIELRQHKRVAGSRRRRIETSEPGSGQLGGERQKAVGGGDFLAAGAEHKTGEGDDAGVVRRGSGRVEAEINLAGQRVT